jgi:hypothetical protein
MSTPAAPLPAPHCAVCGTQVDPDAARCPSCNLAKPAARGSQVLGRSGFWMLGLVLVVVYAIVLVIVAGAH